MSLQKTVYKVLISQRRGGGKVNKEFSEVKIEFSVKYKGVLHKIGIFALSEIRLMLGRGHADYLELESIVKGTHPTISLYNDTGSAPILVGNVTMTLSDFKTWAKKYPPATNWTFLL